MNIISQDVIDQLVLDTSLGLLPTLLTSFVQELDTRRDALETAIIQFNKGDWTGIIEAAHALKSSSGTFGATLLYQSAKQLEDAAREKDQTNITALIEAAKSAADQTYQAYCDYLLKLKSA